MTRCPEGRLKGGENRRAPRYSESVEAELDMLVEYKGQIVSCAVIRSFLWMRKIILPVRGEGYRLVWVARWKVLGRVTELAVA